MPKEGEFLLTPIGYRHRSLMNIVEGGARLRKGDQTWHKLSATGDVLAEIPTDTVPAVTAAILSPPTGWVSDRGCQCRRRTLVHFQREPSTAACVLSLPRRSAA